MLRPEPEAVADGGSKSSTQLKRGGREIDTVT
jgi:hypothetical protein